jgi:hypothetical protein
MHNPICHENSPRKTSLLMTCFVTILAFFSLCNPLPLQAQTSSQDEAAVAKADATIDSVIDHSINMQGLNEAKSISANNGVIVLGHEANTVTVATKPEVKPLQKKSELVEMKPNTQKLGIPTLQETK